MSMVIFVLYNIVFLDYRSGYMRKNKQFVSVTDLSDVIQSTTANE